MSRDRAGVASDWTRRKTCALGSQADRVYRIRYRFAVDRGTSHAPTGLREASSQQSQDIHKNEQPHPHHIHKVPIPARRLEPELVLGIEMPA